MANVDTLLLHDLSGYITANVFENEVKKDMRYPERVAWYLTIISHRPSSSGPRSWSGTGSLPENTRSIFLTADPGNIHNVGVRNGFVRPAPLCGFGQPYPGTRHHGCFATGLGNNSNAATVMAYGKAWFMVPKTIKIELTGHTNRGNAQGCGPLAHRADWGRGRCVPRASLYRAVH